MKDITFNSDETKFLDEIQAFFGTRNLKNHLAFIDSWMELLLVGKLHQPWIKLKHLYLYHEKIDALFVSCYQLCQTPETFATLEASLKVNKDFLATEKQALDYFPSQLNKKELLTPFWAVKTIFKKYNLNYHQKNLRRWVPENLNCNYMTGGTNCIVPLYGHIKKLVSVCWLIHERIITKNSTKVSIYPNPILNFALTTPSLFGADAVNDPFSIIESFFSFTNLSGYREELQKCFMAAIIESQAHESASTLFFMHNQYTSLIQAGYIIVSKKIAYVPKPNKYAGKTMGQWILGVRDLKVQKGEITLSDEEPHVLSLAERAAPMDYCTTALSHDKVVKLRLGLKEWLDEGLSDNGSVNGLDDCHAFELYLNLQKLTEAFYLIITANAQQQAPLTNLCHEA